MKRYNEQVFYKKVVVKNFAIFTEKPLRWSLFLNKNAGLQPWNFIKKGFQHRFFHMNLAKILRTPALENICERLFERFPTWTSNVTRNMGIEGDIFLKTKKKHSNFNYMKKTYIFMMLLIISFFSISPLHASGGVCPT